MTVTTAPAAPGRQLIQDLGVRVNKMGYQLRPKLSLLPHLKAAGSLGICAADIARNFEPPTSTGAIPTGHTGLRLTGVVFSACA